MTEETEQQPESHSFGPGALLKRTREEQGLSIDEVSTRLKLTKPVLNNIENDDYEGDLPVTFYRGYLKNYAELLEIDNVDIVANFQEYCKQNNLFSAPPTKLQGYELNKPVSSNNWGFKIVTGVITVVLLAAIYYMVVEKELWKKLIPESQEQQQSSPINEGDSSLKIGEDSGAMTIDEPESNQVSESQTAAESSLEQNTGEAGANEAGAGVDKLADDEGSLSLSGSEQGVSEQNVSEQSSTEPVNQQPVNDSDLILAFSNDCWVRIEDATGKVLALGIKSAGSSLQLSGQAPYSLTLGKASAVQLSYDGESVDLSQYPDTRAAKLTLGDS